MVATATREPRGHEHPDNGVGARAPRRVLPWRRGVSLAGVIGLLAAALGLLIGLGPLNDNSFFTHLATGRLILDTGSVPSVDPFSFTAAGEPWVVQSWLASVLYAGVERGFGAGGLLALVGVTGAALGAMVWALTRPAGALLGRVLATGLVLAVGAGMWGERPMLFGLAFLGLTMLVAQGRLQPRWLILVFACWVNMHGSFPLGLAALVVLALGRRLDGQSPRVERAALGRAVLGTGLGAISPLGLKLLTFPVELLGRQEILRSVTEWKSPSFVPSYQRAFLVLVVLAIVGLVRRPSWRAALPTLVFVPAALLSVRNIPVASLVVLPGLASGLAGLGSITGEQRRTVFRVAAVALVALASVVLVARTRDASFTLDRYPVAAIDWLDDEGMAPGGRIVADELVGNYLELRYGADANVYADDRFDMFPLPVLRDLITLNRGTAGWDDALDRADPDAVLWAVDAPLGQLLRLSDGWEIAWTDGDWLVAIPAG